MCALADLCALIEAPDEAKILYDQLLPYADYNAVIPVAWMYRGSVARSLGNLAAILGDSDTAEDHLESAIDRDTKMGAPSFVALDQYDLARLRCRQKYDLSDTKTQSLVKQALATASNLGMARLERGLKELLAHPPPGSSQSRTTR